MSTTTTAIVHRHTDSPSKLEQVTLGELQPDEALVEITASGVCHTDLSCMTGVVPASFPNVFGHEGAGTVVTPPSINPASLSPGDKVLLSFAYCGTCKQCSSKYPSYCDDFALRNFSGGRIDGTSALSVADGAKCHAAFFGQSSFMRRAVVHSSSIVRVPADTDLTLYAPLGCGMQTGAGCVLKTLNVQAGASVAVFGCGSVGLAAVMAAKLRGAGMIIAVDLQESRMQIAQDLGATHCINGADKDLVQQLQKLCPPNGVEYAVECTGVPAVVSSMLDALGTRGKAASIGAPTPGVRAGVDVWGQLILGRQYLGCCEGDAVPSEFVPFLIEQHKAGKFPLEKLIKYYPVGEFEQAFKDMKAGSTIKAVLKWDGV